MNVFNIKLSLSPSNFSIPLNLLTCMTWSLSKLYVILDPHLASLLLSHILTILLYITNHSFPYASPHLWNQFPHSLRQPRRDLPLPDLSLLHDRLTSPLSSSPLLSPITPSFYLSNFKTFLFFKSYPL